MAEKLSDKTVADTKSNSVRWGYISLALVLAAIAFLIVPAESSNSTGQVIAGLSYTGRAVVAIAILMATLWVSAALPVAVTALMPLVLFPLCTGGAICTCQGLPGPRDIKSIILIISGNILNHLTLHFDPMIASWT